MPAPSKEQCDRFGGYLNCPECDTPAIPASHLSWPSQPMWCEDDTAACPGCRVQLRAEFTAGGEFMVAGREDDDVTGPVG